VACLPGRRCRVIAASGLASGLLLGAAAVAASARADGPADDASANVVPLGVRFSSEVRPLVARQCGACHADDPAEGGVDLAAYRSLDDLRRNVAVWQRVADVVAGGEMPPADAPQPTADERRSLLAWVREFLAAEAAARAGDPGRVVLRRLSNAEYAFTIRDLTGVATLDPAREFPVDGAAGEGFTNTGQALVMSPALVSKYLEAAKGIAAHAVILPDGFRFSPSAERGDWIEDAIARLRDFYRRFTVQRADVSQQTEHTQGVAVDPGREGFVPIERYLAATLEARPRLREHATTIEAVARERGVSPTYLAALWKALDRPAGAGAGGDVQPRPSILLDRLRSRWDAAQPRDAAALAADIRSWQDALWKFNPVGDIVRQYGGTAGPPSWLEAVDAVTAEKEFRIPLEAVDGGDVRIRLTVGDAGDGGRDDLVVWRDARIVKPAADDVPVRDVLGAASAVPRGEPNEGSGDTPVDDAGDLCMRSGSEVAFSLPAEPGAVFVVTAAIHPRAGTEATVQPLATTGTHDGVGLSPAVPLLAREGTAGRRRLERSCGEFRELLPPAVCYGRIVPVDQTVTLNLFYREDERLVRLMLSDAEAAELDRLWDELLFISEEPLELVDVHEQLVEYAGQERHDQAVMLRTLREPIAARAEAFRRRTVEAEPAQLEAAVAFAGRAFRRPLTADESAQLRGLYGSLRAEDLPHVDALRLVLARALVSPQFLYKVETPGPGVDSRPVDDHELASRLSYFLWSSLPDGELLREAAAGRLHEPAVLLEQTRRMVADPKIRRLATEFGTHWLHVENFAEHDEKSPEAFPEFAALRGAMHEEAVLVLTDLFRNDRPIRSLIDADHTFLNGPLAEFYGIPDVNGSEWRRVEGVGRYGRGGVLGLAATLSKHSGASRTSPILRGTWFTEVLLGQRVPKPPMGVPPLADAPPAGLSERELTALHSQDAACAGCHARFDAFGFALEEFDAIGRRRTVDVAGRPIDAAATLPDGTAVAGHAELRGYLARARGDEFVRQFSRKLLGYALGRSTQLSDAPLLDAIEARLRAHEGRVSAVLEAIVTSPQFREIRGGDAPDTT